jgi:hypothetical protein
MQEKRPGVASILEASYFGNCKNKTGVLQLKDGDCQ